MAREFAKAFYKSKAWQNCRSAYIKSVGGLCEDCLACGIYTPAKVVHHIECITPENINNPRITLDFNNLKAVCQDCHALEHKRKTQNRYIIDENGNIFQR